MDADSAPLYAWKQTMAAVRSSLFQAGEAILAAVAGLVVFGATFERMDAVNAYALVAAAGLGAPAIGLALLFVIQWLRAPYIQRDEAREAVGTTGVPDQLERTTQQLNRITYEGEGSRSSISAIELLLKYADRLAAAEGCSETTFYVEVGREGAKSFLGQLRLYGVVKQRESVFRNAAGLTLSEWRSNLTELGTKLVMALRDAEAKSDPA